MSKIKLTAPVLRRSLLGLAASLAVCAPVGQALVQAQDGSIAVFAFDGNCRQ